MASIRKELKELFNSCTTYVEVFKTISVAIKQGFPPEEVNTAASWRKNRITKEQNQNYKKLVVTEYNMLPSDKFLALPVRVNDLNSPTILFNREEIVI